MNKMSGKVKNGILLLTQLPDELILQKYLKMAFSHIKENLLIRLQNEGVDATQERNNQYRLLRMVYQQPCSSEYHLNVHVLLAPLQSCTEETVYKPEICLLHKESSVKDKLKALFDNVTFKYLDFELSSYHDNIPTLINLPAKEYSGVVIGGTFDRIHNGHKLLLSTALLLAEDKITVGVADGVLLKNKVLRELIEPTNCRINKVRELIDFYKPGLRHKVVPITDPCGPSGTDDDLQLLVVSEETSSGGDFVNLQRVENGLAPLDVHVIDLIEDVSNLPACLNETKISSSSTRVKSLGTLLRPPNSLKIPNKCYVIGMTGGIASGKSSVVERLNKLGAHTINCDKLGHKAYEPGQTAYNNVLKHFGKGVLDDHSMIDRKKLGPIVFSDPEKLQLLNSIVWPEIWRMCDDIIRDIEKSDASTVIIFEGAILFEAGWDEYANEVWCCVIPTNEAVSRIESRDGLTNEHALKRISSQMSNQERVNRSHVVLCTQWEYEFTQQQVQKAWTLLQSRITNSI